jgi:hypothetical protein
MTNNLTEIQEWDNCPHPTKIRKQLAQAINNQIMFFPWRNTQQYNLAIYYHPFKTMSVFKHECQYVTYQKIYIIIIKPEETIISKQAIDLTSQ